MDSPPFPEYTSGHSTFSGAAAAVLAVFFGSDNIAFTAGPSYRGSARCARRCRAAAEMAASSAVVA